MRQQTSCAYTISTNTHVSKLHVSARDQTISTMLYQTKEPESKDSSDNQRQFSSLPRIYTGPSVHGIRILRSTETKTSIPTLGEGVKVQLSPDQSHYLSNVMRIFKKGKKKAEKRVIADGDTCTNSFLVDVSQCVRIFDGKNGEWLARVSAVQDDVEEGENQQPQQRRKRKRDPTPSLYAECLNQIRPQETRQSPWVFFAPIKKHRAKLMIEKCTELGAGMFVPIITERTDSSAAIACIGSSGSNRGKRDGMQSFEGLEKLAIQALEASEQCERLSVPSVLPSAIPAGNKNNLWDTEELLKKWCDNDASVAQRRILLICRERRSDNTIVSARLREASNADGVAFLIGPEGGWSPEEEALFDQYQKEAPFLVQGASLGSFVLRAETAAITCVAACNLHHAESNAN
eukprot:CAMPEP_0178518020 /NCGR_PEP_ID=MMETSP0696-20121128/26016_1 /TAXON_ID=265572 /ORGANISM="Extubocellulus spinifer, Strain CCMP396" /LENGTH=403 /DNA_ID=CAMNT_0020148519 /DNA_START=339 /DNA_END=1550 /DNA_ORIENTATION=+